MPDEQAQTGNPANAPSSSGAGNPSPQNGQQPATASPPSSTPPSTPTERPNWLPEDYWDASAKAVKGDDFRKSFDELRAFKAQEDVRTATRPKTPDEYQVKLPESWKAPEGIEFKFKDDDPLLSQARQWAHKRGLDQDAFTEALELYAGAQVGTVAQIKAAREAEIAKLGTTGPARVDAVMTWMKSMVGDEGARSLSSMLVTADIVSSFEKLLLKYGNQGAGQYNASGRDGGSRAPTDEEWSKMSWNEKSEYTRQAQSRNNGQR